MSNYERIKNAIQASSLSVEDKLAITETFAVISDDYLAEIADLFEQKPEWVEIYNDNRKKKLVAAQSESEEEWMKILEEEKKMLNKLVFDSD